MSYTQLACHACTSTGSSPENIDLIGQVSTLPRLNPPTLTTRVRTSNVFDCTLSVLGAHNKDATTARCSLGSL